MRSKFIAAIFGAGAAPLLAVNLQADVSVPSAFGDHMVLQQDAPLPVWGTADPGETVTVSVGSDTGTATAGADGTWKVTLKALPASSTPAIMTIAGKKTLTFQDVLIGEVWVASGQSNMVFPLGMTVGGPDEVAKVNDPQFRILNDNLQASMTPSTEFKIGAWALASPASTKGLSAAAYYFAKALRAKLHRPVGIIQNPVGGTIAEAWTPLDGLKSRPELQYAVDLYNKVMDKFPAENATYPQRFADWHKLRIAWEQQQGPAYAKAVADYQEASHQAQLQDKPVPPQPKPTTPPPGPPPQPFGSVNTPTVLFNGRVAPLIPFAIRGVIWYQGESNAPNAQNYHTALSTMITSWRQHWGEGDFPFILVQLPNFEGGARWPEIREAQAQTTSLPNCAMAVAIDAGDQWNLHPANKTAVGERLALAARHLVYGEKDLVWTGPVYDSMKIEGGTIRISFTQIGGGLTIGSPPYAFPRAVAHPPTQLSGFSIADDTKTFSTARAKIDGNTVIVYHDKIPHPVAVRYGWMPSPYCNLYNKEALPAAPFRTDDWPIVPPTPAPKPVPPAAKPPPPVAK
jgi:sialate O-acetylesterase